MTSPSLQGASWVALLPEDCWELIVQCYIRLPALEDFETKVLLLEDVARDSICYDERDACQVHHFHHYETARRVCRSWRDWATPFFPDDYLPALIGYVSPMAGAPALGSVGPKGRILGWHSSVPEQPSTLVLTRSGRSTGLIVALQSCLYVPVSAVDVDCLACYFCKPDPEYFYQPPQSRAELFVESGHFINDDYLPEQLLQLAREKDQKQT